MDLKIPKLTAPLDLADYAPEMAGQVIHIWLNPPSDIRQEYLKLRVDFEQIHMTLAESMAASAKKKKTDDDKKRILTAEQLADIQKQLEETASKQDAWLSSMWSQHPDAGTHIPAEQVTRLRQETLDGDPAFYSFLVSRTLEMMLAHRADRKKK